MPVQEWHLGDKLPSPVYLDSNVIAASFVQKDRRYKPASQLLAELMADDAEVVISPLTVSESVWALAKMSYHELQNQPFHTTFHQQIFKRHCAAIFARYRARMNSVFEWIRSWRTAGVSITVFPTDMDMLQNISQTVSRHMEVFTIGSSDAFHLACAEQGARSLVTGDEDFRNADLSAVEIFYIPKP